MNTIFPRRILPFLNRRRRDTLLRVFAAVLALTMLASGLGRTAPAHADASCGSPDPITGAVTPCPPADLLNATQLAGGLYAATADQRQSLQVLEQQAVTNTLQDHGLPSSDAVAAQTWGRDDAEAELWGLLVQAIQTPACGAGQTPGQGCRTADQQNAVDWLGAMDQREGVQAADDAGLEYVKWAGLDQTAYKNLLGGTPSQSDLQNFLSGQVVNYNNPSNPGASTGGYCIYRSPAPYQSDYTGYDDQTCFTACSSLLGCTPPTPTYDQFVKWGEADVNNQLFDTADFASVSRDIAVGAGFGGAVVGAGVTGAALSSALAGVLGESALQTAIFPYLAIPLSQAAAPGALGAEATAELAGGLAAGAVGFIVAVVIAAVAIAVIEGINVVSAAQLPSQLASLIAGAPTNTPDLNAILNDPNQAKGLYALFVGATLPTPQLSTCDNSQIISVGNTITAPCLNAPPVPSPATADPEFVVQQQGATTTTYTDAISWEDAVAKTSTTARLSGNWFIDQVTLSPGNTVAVQTLRMHYTDWNGKEQTAWLLGNATDGYKFVTVADLSESGSPLNPTTCLADNTCAYSSTIDYVGTDGNDYSASVVPAVTPNVTVSVSANPVEGSPVTFTASGSSPSGLPITYQWQFAQASPPPPPGGIISQCDDLNGNPIPCPPAYGAPVTGAQVSYTWQTGGTSAVQLTATDSAGKSTVDTFTIAVADVPPTLSLWPTAASFPSNPFYCAISNTCDTHTVSIGSGTTLHGSITHAGTGDPENLTIDWGDGSVVDFAGSGPYGISSDPPGDVTLTVASPTELDFIGTHTYAKTGAYTVKVSVADGDGGTATTTITETVQGLPTSTTLVSSANPAVFGQPVTYTATVSPIPDGGTVAFGGNSLVSVACPAVPVDPKTGTATCAGLSYNGLWAGLGAHPVTASYSGDATYSASSSTTLTQAVNQAGTTVTLTSSAATAVVGQPVTYTATVNVTAPGSGTPTGTLTFMDGATAVAGCDTLLPGSETLTCTTTYAAPGSHAITAAYSGDTDFGASTSSALTETVNKAATTVTLTSSAAAAPFGQPVTLTASVGAAAPGAGTPTGTVTFLDGGSAIGTATLANGQASLTTGTLLGGTHSLTVSYGGDANFTGGTSNTLSQAITFSSTVSGTANGPQTVQAGQTVLIDGTVNGPLTVQAGASVALMGAHVNGPLKASGAGAVVLCGSTVGGPVSVSGSTGFVRLGAGADDPGVACGADTIRGPLSLSGNTGGVEVEGATVNGPLSLTNNTGAAPGQDGAGPELEGNTIGGPLSCAGNSPAPTADGHPNTVNGPRSGQCTGM